MCNKQNVSVLLILTHRWFCPVKSSYLEIFRLTFYEGAEFKKNRDVERKKGTINTCLFHKNPKGTSKPSPLCSHLEATAAFKGLSSAVRLVGG